MTTKQLIAIDIDDTIADSTESLRLKVNKQLAIDLPQEAYRINADYWGYYERVWEAHDVSGLSYDDLTKEMVDDQSHVPLLPSAELAIYQLAEQYEIVLITARDKSWEAATRRWLADNLGGKVAEVYFTSAHKDKRDMTKGQLCRHLGAKVLIDDNVEHCQSALDEGIEAILFGQYGWHHTAPKSMRCCKDWQSVLEYFDGR